MVQCIAETATARLMLEQGDADFVAGLTAEALTALAAIPGIVTVEGIGLGNLHRVEYRDAPYDNPTLRQALAYALNYDAAITRASMAAARNWTV